MGSEAACGPAASSAIVTAETAISAGSEAGPSRSSAITTDVSMRPRSGGGLSGTTRRRVLIYASVQVVAEPLRVDSWSARKGRDGRRRCHEATTTRRDELTDVADLVASHDAPSLVVIVGDLVDLPRTAGRAAIGWRREVFLVAPKASEGSPGGTA